MEEIVKIINSVGFPIAMCIYVLFVLKNSMDKLYAQMELVNQKQAQVLDSIKQLIDYVISRGMLGNPPAQIEKVK